MSIETANAIHAAGTVEPGIAPFFVTNRGFNGLTRNGDGDYTLDMEASAAAGSAVAVATSVDSVLGNVCTIHRPSASQIRVLVTDNGGLAIEAGFSIVVFKVIG